jgi:hypothetical protein
MLIYEITKQSLSEGFWGDLKTIGSTVGSKSALSNIGKGFVQGIGGVNFRDQPPADIAAAQAAQQALQTANERIVVTLVQPGQTSETKYYKTGTVWTNEQGQQITRPQSIAYLDKMIPTHGKKETIAAQPASQTRRVSRQRAPGSTATKRTR